jgi:hypothetical protein
MIVAVEEKVGTADGVPEGRLSEAFLRPGPSFIVAAAGECKGRDHWEKHGSRGEQTVE